MSLVTSEDLLRSLRRASEAYHELRTSPATAVDANEPRAWEVPGTRIACPMLRPASGAPAQVVPEGTSVRARLP
jgi:hypothetical protein